MIQFETHREYSSELGAEQLYLRWDDRGNAGSHICVIGGSFCIMPVIRRWFYRHRPSGDVETDEEHEFIRLHLRNVPGGLWNDQSERLAAELDATPIPSGTSAETRRLLRAALAAKAHALRGEWSLVVATLNAAT